jgi:hypothetical protein
MGTVPCWNLLFSPEEIKSLSESGIYNKLPEDIKPTLSWFTWLRDNGWWP